MNALYIVANLGIFTAYLFVAFALMPNLPVRLFVTKISGVLFFLTCGLTHMELAIHALTSVPIDLDEMTSLHQLVIHVPQALAAWAFVLGLYQELIRGPRRANRPSAWPGAA